MSTLSVSDKTDHTNRSRGSVIAIGNFDGFHLGHRKIIEHLKQIAREKSLHAVILTFTPNPRVYFKKEFPLIHTDAQKRKMLENLDVDQVVIMNFNEIAEMSDERFLREVLIEKYNMKHMVMGENFRFGKGRKGDIEFLELRARQWGFGLTVVKSVTLDQHRISSTAIREKLSQAKIEEANRMLGRCYSIEGVVVEGDKVGTGLGFPTINLETENTLLPEGVFKTRVEIEGKTHASITYIGYRPTFTGSPGAPISAPLKAGMPVPFEGGGATPPGREKKVESHIFNFDKEIYGRWVIIFFERKLRDEIKFDSKSNLIKQIEKDIENLKVDKGPFF